MKRIRKETGYSAICKLLAVTLMAAVIAWLPVALPAAEAGAAASQTAALANRDDVVCVEVVHSREAAASTGKSNQLYTLTGYKWLNLPSSGVTYEINGSTIPGDNKTAAINAIMTSAETWDAATGKELFNDVVKTDSTLHYGVGDGHNTIEFGPVSNSSTIAVTMYWFNRSTRSLVEFDMKFNTYYTWGDASVTKSLMDIQNIATHEFGHAIGLGDLYKSIYAKQTMYGYSNNGDIEKRSLESGDIAGVQSLYPN